MSVQAATALSVRLAASTLAALLVASPALRAHGTTYRGPSATRGPADTAPPPPPSRNGGGVPPAGGGGGGARGGPPRWGPGTYNGPGTGWGWTSGNVPYVEGLDGTAWGGADPTEWSLYWAVKSAPWIGLKRALRRPEVRTGSDDYFIGRGATAARTATRIPSQERLDADAVPALLDALAADGAVDLVTGALVALGKLGGASEHRDAIERALAARLADGNQEVAETAAVALGILGGRGALSALRDLALDTPAGRRLAGREASVSTRTRAFATYGLALAARASDDPTIRRAVVDDLRTIADEPVGALPDVHVAALVGVGLVPLAPGPDRARDLEWLTDQAFGRRHREPLLRAHAITSLARLTTDAPERELVERLLDAADPRARERAVVRQAAVLGLGRLAVRDAELAERIVAALVTQTRKGDPLARRFAWMSLARFGGAPTTPHVATAGVQKQLRLALRRTGANRERPWVALAAGCLQRSLLDQGAVDTELAEALRASLADARAPDDVAAYASALGLAHDVEAEPLLREALERTADDAARGRVALALGMLGSARSSDRLRALVDGAGQRTALLTEGSIGLALLGDRGVGVRLAARLGATSSRPELGALAAALGSVGDERALDPLLAILGDERAGGSVRGYAAVALGSIGDPRELPWNACIAARLHYVAATDTLSNERGTGVLDIL